MDGPGLLHRAGYGPDEPVLVAVQRAGGPPETVIRGTGQPLTASTRIYQASLAKQVVAAGAALLTRAGRLDPATTLTHWLPELPRWAASVRLRHLVHHTAGLPEDVALPASGDRTTEAVLAALARLPSPPRPPGQAFAYSNAGYVCLARAVERAAGQPLAAFARDHLFAPLGLADTLFWTGPGPAPPASRPTSPAHPAPLSLGDGGLWSTAADMLRWSHAMNDDVLGLSAQLQTPGTLDDGRLLDYAWGIGVRSHAGHRVYRHGGGWPGLRLLQARVPALRLSFLVIATQDDTERRVVLGDALLDDLCGRSAQ